MVPLVIVLRVWYLALTINNHINYCGLYLKPNTITLSQVQFIVTARTWYSYCIDSWRSCPDNIFYYFLITLSTCWLQNKTKYNSTSCNHISGMWYILTSMTSVFNAFLGLNLNMKYICNNILISGDRVLHNYSQLRVLIPCCNVCYDFRITAMFGSILFPFVL